MILVNNQFPERLLAAENRGNPKIQFPGKMIPPVPGGKPGEGLIFPGEDRLQLQKGNPAVIQEPEVPVVVVSRQLPSHEATVGRKPFLHGPMARGTTVCLSPQFFHHLFYGV